MLQLNGEKRQDIIEREQTHLSSQSSSCQYAAIVSACMHATNPAPGPWRHGTRIRGSVIGRMPRAAEVVISGAFPMNEAS
jgi:hypothetical protein